MKYLMPFVLINTIFFFQYCKSTEYLPDNYPKAQIVFGSGGGFAGTYNYYYLLKDGSLFKNSSTDSTFQKVKKLEKAKVSQIFKNIELFDLKNYSFNDPGNMNYFIELKDKEGTHQIQWGGNNREVDQNVKTIYQILNNFLK